MTSLSALEPLAWGEAAPDRPVLAWSGLDVPLEVAEAAGFWPSRLRGRGVDVQDATASLSEGGGHPGMKALTAEILSRGLKPADRLALGSTPVTGVWLYNLFLSLGPAALPCPVDLVDIERQTRPSSTQRNLETINRWIGSFAPPPSPGALHAAIVERNRLRRALRSLDRLRVDRLSGTEAQMVFAACDAAPALPLRPLLDQLLAEVEARPTGGGVPIVYSGGAPGYLDLYRALEQRGLRIVADDQDFGSRAVGPDVDETGEPAGALAERYRARDPAPAGWSTKARTRYLLDLALSRGAKAVVFDIPAFDHPAAWDQPRQAAALADHGVGAIVIPPEVLGSEARAEACLELLREAEHV